MDANKIASRIAKSMDADEISDEWEHWSSYLDETLKSARAFIGKLEVLRDFLDKAGDDPTDKWRRVVALAVEAKDELPNDAFVQEADAMRSKMREWTRKPLYTVSPGLSDRASMDPVQRDQAMQDARQDEEAIGRMMQELTKLLKQFHSRW
jgi:hypothetical protein